MEIISSKQEAQRQLAALLAEVQRGTTFLIEDDGGIVARMRSRSDVAVERRKALDWLLENSEL